MAELAYTRVPTNEQSTDRQTHLITEAGLVDGAHGVQLFADPATSSKIPALERDGFRRLAGYARTDDRLTVSGSRTGIPTKIAGGYPTRNRRGPAEANTSRTSRGP